MQTNERRTSGGKSGSIATTKIDTMTFDVTIPVLNEAPTLEIQVRKLYAFLRKQFPDARQWRIVIADNGSTDGTLPIAQRLAEELPEVVSLTVPRKGVGLALKHAWEHSEADFVGYMDLDLATDLNHFLQAYQALASGRYDLVYGTRLHANSVVIGRTLKREITSRVFNAMLRLYLGIRFSDGMCGFKWLRRDLVPSLRNGGAVSDGWFFSTELLSVAEWKGYRMLELPVRWTDDISSSRVRILPLARQYVRAMKVLKAKKSIR
ncbi:MAG: hypothetical protein RLY31_3255 [Bacteroidota bacterium]|jgi:glycosyltransferase involved in cell wall biosynthesis